MNMRTLLRGLAVTVASALVCVGGIGNALASEVAEGTVLSKENYATLEGQTFQGIKIADLLNDTQKMWIKNYNLKMKLGKTTELKLDPAYLEATKKYAGTAKFDPQSKTVSNYKAGIPFPKVDVNDPDAGYKLAWNNYFANPILGDNWIATGDVTIVEADKGVVDRFEAKSAKMIMQGRTAGGPEMIGNPEDHARYLLVLSKPYDLAGLGIFTLQYNNGKMDDAWAYVKSIRRTRRVAGGKSWMDPQPKMDLLNDDNQGMNAYPLWYQSWKVVGKRWILAVVDGHKPNNKPQFKEYVEQATPYWNPTNVTWEPREVYVIDATPPKEHPYSKKVFYMDAQYPFFYQMDAYDRKGDFWRMWRESYFRITAKNGQPGLGFNCTQAIDFQRNRATYIDILNTNLNNPALTDKEFSPDMLMQAGAGGLDKFLK